MDVTCKHLGFLCHLFTFMFDLTPCPFGEMHSVSVLYVCAYYHVRLSVVLCVPACECVCASKNGLSKYTYFLPTFNIWLAVHGP